MHSWERGVPRAAIEPGQVLLRPLEPPSILLIDLLPRLKFLRGQRSARPEDAQCELRQVKDERGNWRHFFGVLLETASDIGSCALMLTSRSEDLAKEPERAKVVRIRGENAFRDLNCMFV
jgi:hypothetical protein